MLISADPGARAHTLGSWLARELLTVCFEPGIVFDTKFKKVHTDFGNVEVQNYSDIKIRIRPSFEKLSTHMYLFLVKNVCTQIPNFSKNPYDLETATKMIKSAKDWFKHDQQVDHSKYNIVCYFEDTYNIEFMIELYKKINFCSPSNDEISTLEQINKLNDVCLDKNHACVVSSMIIKRERELNLLEEHRFWSFPEIYTTTPISELYDTIFNCIDPKNYGIVLK